MGDGEVVGNLSVHWKIDHGTGAAAPLIVNQGNPNRPVGNHHVNTTDKAQGRDPKPVGQVRGTHKNAKDGYFGVRLRFESAADANTAFQEALAAPLNVAGGFYVEVNVRAIERPNPNAAPDAEVKIEW